MKNIILFLILLAVPALAVPTGTVTRAVITDTNGVLIGTSTNLLSANGIASTGDLASVSWDLAAVSNLAVSGVASAAVAQATADAAVSTGQAAQVTADAAMATGQAAQVAADYAMATGQAAQATADAAVSTNYTGKVVLNLRPGEETDYEALSIRSGDITPMFGFYGNTGTNWLAYEDDEGNDVGFWRVDSVGWNHYWKVYDEGNFVAGTHYLSPVGVTSIIRSNADMFVSTNGVTDIIRTNPAVMALKGAGLTNMFYGENMNFHSSLLLRWGGGGGFNDIQLGAVAPMGGYPESSGYFGRRMGSTTWKVYDSGNFVSGTHYAPANCVLSSINWIDLVAPGMSLAGGAAAPQLTATGTGRGISGMGYDNNDIAYGALQMPHNLALTNATRDTLYVVPHVHWSLATAPTTNTNITWELIWEWGNINGGFDLAGTNTVTVSASTATNSFLTSFGHVTNNAAGISSLFRFRLGRVASGADDYGATRVILDQFDIHVPVDRIGSAQETTQ